MPRLGAFGATKSFLKVLSSGSQVATQNLDVPAERTGEDATAGRVESGRHGASLRGRLHRLGEITGARERLGTPQHEVDENWPEQVRLLRHFFMEDGDADVEFRDRLLELS